MGFAVALAAFVGEKGRHARCERWQGAAGSETGEGSESPSCSQMQTIVSHCQAEHWMARSKKHTKLEDMAECARTQRR